MKKIYLIAVIVALVAGVATYFFATELKTSKIVTGVNEASVLVAVEDIKENTILTEEMFQVVKLPVTAVSYGTVCNAKDIIGYMATDRILKGEQLMARKITIVGDGEYKTRLSYELSNGMYAYSIRVKDENAVSYFLKEYDYINIYRDTPITPEPVLENVQVIRIGDYNANIQQDAGTEITSYTLITLALKKDQIPKLMDLEDPDADGSPELFKVVLVSHAESHGIANKIEKISVPEDRNKVPQTNYGMGELTPTPPTTESN